MLCLIDMQYNKDNLYFQAVKTVALELDKIIIIIKQSPKLHLFLGFQSILAGVVSTTSSTVLIWSCPPLRLQFSGQLCLVFFGDFTSFWTIEQNNNYNIRISRINIYTCCTGFCDCLWYILYIIQTALFCLMSTETAEMIHLIVDCVIHSLVRLYSNNPFVHHKRWLHCNDISS